MKPLNTVMLSGPAGAPVTVSLDGAGIFNINGFKTWSGNLGTNGTVELQVFSLEAGLVSVDAYITNAPATSAYGSITFTHYTPGAGALTGYAIATGAAANGVMRNSIYLQADLVAGVSYARFQITNSDTARFVGTALAQSATVELYDDGTASIDLTDSVAESVTVTLSLPEASGSTVISSCAFVAFPPATRLFTL
ncbi:hypothetical protein LMA04_20075 [Pseudescherichia vulneris]|uniref:hypothetical protein n=1 Tax=Pseudescherichia vulneris TaxID=566 RepID=UPI00227B0053|nr:hypothetical protein [Pseudescherichia vulneris]WAH52343.1 hypothetical protein LMA04_20075 [Pseudescherichia vulneris]